MTDYEKLLEEADRVHSAFGGGDTDVIARLAAALREVVAEAAKSRALDEERFALFRGMQEQRDTALATIGKIRCVVGKEGTDDDVLDAVRSALADVEAMRAVVDAAEQLASCDLSFFNNSLVHYASKLRDALRALDARGKGRTA